MIIKGDLERMAGESVHPGSGLMTQDSMDVPSHASHLLLQLNCQRTGGFLCDVVIVVQNALFRAHKNILAASSIYLKSLVVHGNLINLDNEMVSPGVFRVILDYIYTGRLSQDDSESGLGAVLAAASYLQLLDLVALCRKRLKRNEKYQLVKGGIAEGGRCWASIPVIKSCFSGGMANCRSFRELPAEELVSHPLAAQAGELYAPAPSASSKSSQIYPMTLAVPHTPGPETSNQSPFYGLDLSKKSPDSQARKIPTNPASTKALQCREEGCNSPAPQVAHGNGCPSAPDKGSVLSGDTEEMKLSLSHPNLNRQLLPSLPRGQDLCTPDAGSKIVTEGGGYCWVENVPLSYIAEDEEEDEEEGYEEEDVEEDEDEEGLRRPEMNPRKGREDEKSSSSSEDVGDNKGRRFCMTYEPETLGDNLYVCIPCGKGFPSSEQLNAHVEAHTEEELYGPVGGGVGEVGHSNGTGDAAAPVAPTALESRRGLGGLGIEAARPYQCSACEKSYKDPATLRQHEKTHWLTRPYPCGICGKKFTQRGTMTRHMRSHLGLKPFACDACGMRFTRQYRLTEHSRIHSGEKPFVCQVCGGRFAQQRNLISHMKMHSVGAVTAGEGKPQGEDLPEAMHGQERNEAGCLDLRDPNTQRALGTLVQPPLVEGLYPFSKLAAVHLGIFHSKMNGLRIPLLRPLPSEPHGIDSFSPA